MDLRTLAAAYDRSAGGYDQTFRGLQREKYRAAAALLLPWLHASASAGAPGGPLSLPAGARVLDAGAGTGLFAEWLSTDTEPLPAVRAALREPLEGGRLFGLDASLPMVRRARPRGERALCADLAAPPLRQRSFQLVLAFTAVLDRVPLALAALGALVAPGGALCVTFLFRESPEREAVAAACGLGYLGGDRAGQDRLHLLVRDRTAHSLETRP
jgi:SAM-dependent methyltransferase